METKATIYFVDSENVNDAWIKLIPLMQEEDEILVFYTDRSPHMSYDKVIELTKLTSRTIQWIKCVEGCNALDFQLVTELGARVALQENSKFVIVSNDCGFEAVVTYWSERQKDVCRMKSSECMQLTAKTKMQKKEVLQNADAQDAASVQEMRIAYGADIEQLSKSIPLSKLTLFHDAFVCIYNQKIGDEIYYYMKHHREELVHLSANYLQKKKARVKNYLYQVLASAEKDVTKADLIIDIYHSVADPKKDLQKINQQIIKQFGQAEGAEYYKILKKHVKIMCKL